MAKSVTPSRNSPPNRLPRSLSPPPAPCSHRALVCAHALPPRKLCCEGGAQDGGRQVAAGLGLAATTAALGKPSPVKEPCGGNGRGAEPGPSVRSPELPPVLQVWPSQGGAEQEEHLSSPCWPFSIHPRAHCCLGVDCRPTIDQHSSTIHHPFVSCWSAVGQPGPPCVFLLRALLQQLSSNTDA